MGIASLVLGIVSVLVAWIPVVNIGFLVPAIVGLVLGIVSTVSKKKKDEKIGIPVAGIVLSSVAILITLVWTITLAIGIGIAINGVEPNNINDMITHFETIDRMDGFDRINIRF